MKCDGFRKEECNKEATHKAVAGVNSFGDELYIYLCDEHAKKWNEYVRKRR